MHRATGKFAGKAHLEEDPKSGYRSLQLEVSSREGQGRDGFFGPYGPFFVAPNFVGEVVLYEVGKAFSRLFGHCGHGGRALGGSFLRSGSFDP